MNFSPKVTREISNSHQMQKTITRMAHQIIEKLELPFSSPLVLLGIPHGGVFLAYRLAKNIEKYSDIPVFTGILDITMYRDDLISSPYREVQPSVIPENGIDNAHVILVDDVLYTGRSVRSALDAMRDMGRPKIVQLAVLVDRGHRELPIRADFVGKNLPTSRSEEIDVSFSEEKGVDGIFICSQQTVSDIHE